MSFSDIFTDAERLWPLFMVEATASVVDQTSGDLLAYDLDRVAPHLQRSILTRLSSDLKDPDDFSLWDVVLGPRQSGKTLCPALGGYYYIAARPGSSGAIIADKRERAEELFRYILTNHGAIPDELRPRTIPNRESRQLTFDHGDGVTSKIKTLSAESSNVGIGRALDLTVWSEVPFAANAAKLWNGLLPAIVNRKNAKLIMESTPAPMSEPSAEFYKDMCLAARQGNGRFRFLFAPFYSSLLNERTWQPDWKVESHEQKLLDRFGPQNGQPLSSPGEWRYLTLENLAFRRHILANDAEVRRYPDLFKVFYPTDPVTCWASVGGGVIPGHVLENHLTADLTPWNPIDGYMEYKPPHPNAQYVIGVDPAGLGGGDQASFHVIEVWGDRWEQVAVFSSNLHDPITVALKVAKTAMRYNHAQVIVENNGVGLATLTPLIEATRSEGTIIRGEKVHLKRLYYHQMAGRADTKPGIPASAKTKGEAINYLIDALMDTLVLHDDLTIDQLQSYRRDSETQASDKWQVLNVGQTMRGRREKHHWDRVSALGWAVYAARRMPVRYKPKTPEEIQQDNEALEQAILNRDYLREDRRKWLDERNKGLANKSKVKSRFK
jgi:hypothetical protein